MIVFDIYALNMESCILPLKHMSSMLIVGPSQAGKSTFVESLITNKEIMFDIPPRKIHWFTGSSYKPDPKNNIQVYEEGLPDNFDMVLPHEMVILDDLMMEAANSELVSNLFTRLVHHLPCTVISIVQNLFSPGKQQRTRSLNSKYIVLFKSPRDASQIECLGRQMYPGEKGFLTEAYKHATGKHPYAYLFIDMHQTTPDKLRIRSNILPDEVPQSVYLPPSHPIIKTINRI
jgi:hypothetical protein